MADLLVFTTILLTTFVSFASYAQTNPPTNNELLARIKVLEAKQAKLEQSESTLATAMGEAPAAEDAELTRLRLQLLLPEPLGPSFSGLAPGMSRIYSSRSPTVVGGFAEIQYLSNNDGPRTTSVSRFNPYLSFRFSQGLVFNSGLSFRNDGVNQGTGNANVEFAYLDLLFGADRGLRMGHVIVPFGLVAYRGEPTLFPMVNRPLPERTIIPSTWHENGLLGFGKIGSVLLQGGIVNAGDAANYQRDTWIRSGRQNGANASANNAGFVLRTEVLTTTATAGLSLYGGNSSQGNNSLGEAQVLLAAVHGEVRSDRFSAKALYTEGSLGDTDKIFAVTQQAVGSRVRGGYAILAYDLLPRIAPYARSLVDTPVLVGWRELPIFASYEFSDPQAAPAIGQDRTMDFATTRLTLGINYKPHQQVVLKTDFAYEAIGSGRASRIIEVGIGAVF